MLLPVMTDGQAEFLNTTINDVPGRFSGAVIGDEDLVRMHLLPSK